MIEVKVREDMLALKGHACRKGSDGIDRACAAVSASHLQPDQFAEMISTGDRIRADTGSGMNRDRMGAALSRQQGSCC